MAITLRNNTKRRLSFVLPHDVVCTDKQCLCTITTVGGRVLNPESGEYGIRSEEVRVPSAVHISAGTTSAPLPDEVKNVPTVAEAIRRRAVIAD